MFARPLLLAALLAIGALSARLPDWYERELEDAAFAARLVRDQGAIRTLVGDRLQGGVVFVELRVKPLYGSKVTLARDEFLVRARNTNDTSPAQSPHRIAGDKVLRMSGKRKTKAAVKVISDPSEARVWGGAPGTGTDPKRVESPTPAVVVAVSREDRRKPEQVDAETESVADRLQELELPLETVDAPVTGYLYFEIPADIGRKQLELSYAGRLGEFLIKFGESD